MQATKSKEKEIKVKEPSELKEVFTAGLFKENQLFIALLGICPALAVTDSFEKALGMALLVVIILTITNIIISAVRKIVPDTIRIPSYIVIIATTVTIIELLVKAFLPELSSSLGVFIALITVNCIVLGRAEAFASKNNVKKSIFDAFGMGLGFGGAIVLVGLVRELLGTGTIMIGNIFTFIPLTSIIPYKDPAAVANYFPSVLTKAPGAFIVLGLLLALFMFIGRKKAEKKELLAKEQRRAEREEKRGEDKWQNS